MFVNAVSVYLLKYGQSFLFLEFMHFVCPSYTLCMVMSYMCSPFVFSFFLRAFSHTPGDTLFNIQSVSLHFGSKSYLLIFSHLSQRAFSHLFENPCNAVLCVYICFPTTVNMVACFIPLCGHIHFHISHLFLEIWPRVRCT